MSLVFGFFSNLYHVSGQLLPFNDQPDLFSHLRDHSAIFVDFGDDFDTLGMSLGKENCDQVMVYADQNIFDNSY